MKYEVTVTGIGDFVLPFMQTRESVILFNKDVPYEYENMVVSHTKAALTEDVAVGDTLHLADRSYTVTAVGDEAMKTLRENGHCTICLYGKGCRRTAGTDHGQGRWGAALHGRGCHPF